MFITKEFTIAADTTADSPYIESFAIPSGHIQLVNIAWRWGSADLCGTKLWHHENQIIPYTLNEWLPSFDNVLNIPLDLNVMEAPRELTIHAYNTDDTYQHKVWLGLAISRKDEYEDMQRAILSALYDFYTFMNRV